MTELLAAIEPFKAWQYSPDHDAGISRAKTYVAGSDKDVLVGFFVTSVNEWKMKQERVLVLTPTSYYRVAYDHKTGKIDHYHKSPLDELRVIEKTAMGLKVYTRKQDGNRSVGKWVSSMIKKAKDEKPNEFEHAREYFPVKPLVGPQDIIIDAIAAVFAKTAELLSKTRGFDAPSVITTYDRHQILADRKEAERLEKERVEREAATEELRMAIRYATDSRQFDGLIKPLRRAKRAVEVDLSLLDEAEKLKEELEEEKRENERLAKLEEERVEREGATEELKGAIEAATGSRMAATLSKPIKRAKKAVEVDPSLIDEAEKLKEELEEEKRENERLAKLEEERVEREGATEELKGAIEAAKGNRDATTLSKPIKRAKKAVDVSLDLIREGEALKAEIEEEKRAAKAAEAEAARQAKEQAKAEAAEAGN